jgi:hypothetical protein
MPQLGDVTVFGTALPSVPLKLDTPPRAHPTLDWITVVRATSFHVNALKSGKLFCGSSDFLQEGIQGNAALRAGRIDHAAARRLRIYVEGICRGA